MRRAAQVFIHRYYENIKLVLLLIILCLVGYVTAVIVSENARTSEARGEAVIRIVESIERETDDQTKIINRQFQALCFLLVETSGSDTLKQLDPPLEEQCRNLTRELQAQEVQRQRDEERTPHGLSPPRRRTRSCGETMSVTRMP